MQPGKVLIAGAGPGDLDLVTVGVMKALKRCGVLLYDKLVNEALIKEVREGTEVVYVGKSGSPDERSHRQSEINQMMVAFAKQGKIVLRLKGGDPLLFARGSEECEYLVKHSIPFEILPGVSSPTAGLSYAGIPLTHREYSRSVVFATGHLMEGEDNQEIVIPQADTVVFLMGIKNLETLVEKLLQKGYAPDTPAAIVEQATLRSQRVFTGQLDEMVEIKEKEKVKPPALFVIGKVVNLREVLKWQKTSR